MKNFFSLFTKYISKAFQQFIFSNFNIAEYIITRGKIVEQKKEKITKTAHFIKNYLKIFIRDVKFFPSTLFSTIFATFPKNYRFS
jgi:hypothetical protein